MSVGGGALAPIFFGRVAAAVHSPAVGRQKLHRTARRRRRRRRVIVVVIAIPHYRRRRRHRCSSLLGSFTGGRACGFGLVGLAGFAEPEALVDPQPSGGRDTRLREAEAVCAPSHLGERLLDVRTQPPAVKHGVGGEVGGRARIFPGESGRAIIVAGVAPRACARGPCRRRHIGQSRARRRGHRPRFEQPYAVARQPAPHVAGGAALSKVLLLATRVTEPGQQPGARVAGEHAALGPRRADGEGDAARTEAVGKLGGELDARQATADDEGGGGLAHDSIDLLAQTPPPRHDGAVGQLPVVAHGR